MRHFCAYRSRDERPCNIRGIKRVTDYKPITFPATGYLFLWQYCNLTSKGKIILG